ncbi:hypothetical protein K435DRAFT_874824 [Dendrothele bispora CBS 962.96]|uniref:NB-ARC domain-containing protein n=1 Tax=Dendrothele bispora (strain CBS 962.96) TaxID=1314807 RepID=A0A4S8KVP3_DENBC|nr:hypothetical protein K435DRAFT_874824 [Dendrothele bispora CBS 962.96]
MQLDNFHVSSNSTVSTNFDNQLSSETMKITADMIASATPALPLVFKGREKLVEQGVNILSQQALRFLAILGAGGMGKTSLALHIMDSPLLKDKFAGRCHFIPCQLFQDTESLVQGLLHVMELTMRENQSKQEVLFNHLQASHGDLLIVFDNFETPWNYGESRIGVKNLLEKIAQIGGPGDIQWERLGDQSGIPILSPIPAREVFKAFTGNKLQGSDETESQIDSLLYQLEYIPFAIKLAAQRVKRVPLEEVIIISFLPDGIPFWIKHLPQMFPGEDLSLNVSTLLNSSLIYECHEGLKMLAPVKKCIQLKYPIGQADVDQLEMFYELFLTRNGEQHSRKKNSNDNETSPSDRNTNRDTYNTADNPHSNSAGTENHIGPSRNFGSINGDYTEQDNRKIDHNIENCEAYHETVNNGDWKTVVATGGVATTAFCAGSHTTARIDESSHLHSQLQLPIKNAIAIIYPQFSFDQMPSLVVNYILLPVVLMKVFSLVLQAIAG